jgi:radical SAM superfamily enzyme YgiQ (UPF0313 family)
MNVVILTTDTYTKPIQAVRYLGPYQIAWWLRENGYSTQVLDFLIFMSKTQRLALYKKYITPETKIVGYAPFFAPLLTKNDTKLKIFSIIQEINEHFPWVKLVIGGMFVKSLKKDFNFLKDSPIRIDAVFEGEAENSFLEYCNYIYKGEGKIKFTLFNNLKMIYPTETYNIQNCSMKYAENDFILENESVPFELSRGCVFKCNFCQYKNIGKDKDDFNKSMNCVRDSFISNYNLGITRYHFSDDTLNSHRERTKELLQITKDLDFKIEYNGYVRMDLLDIWPEQRDILPESGLVSCHFGIESFDPESCNQIGKGWGAKNNKRFLKYINEEVWKDDVIIKGSFICGLGKETEKEWQDTYDWLVDSKVHDFYMGPLHLDKFNRGSEFEKNPEKFGYRFDDNSVPWYWRNDYNDFGKTLRWTSKIKRDIRDSKRRIPGAWAFTYMRNLGFSKEEILNGNYFSLYSNADNLFKKFVQKYYDKAINY